MRVSVPPTPPDIQTILNTPPDKLPRNKQTEEIHKREVWWQIHFPLLIGLAMVAGLVSLTIMAAVSPGAGTTRVWADISLMFVIAQVMVVIIPWLFVFGGVAYGILYLIRILPPYFKVAQDYTALAALRVEQVMRYVIEPVLQIKSGVAGFDRIVQNVRKFLGR